MLSDIQFVPRTRDSKKLIDCSKVKYVISSHVAYSSPLVQALQTMKNIPDQDKCIVIAGSSQEQETEIEGVKAYSVTENAYELTCLIHACKHPEKYEGYDYILLLHDTIECGSRMRDLVEAHVDSGFDISYACFPPRTNIGLYKIDFLVKNRDVIEKYDGMSKATAMLIEECGDELSLDRYTEKITHFENAKFEKRGPHNRYSGDTRWEAYIHSIDIKKWYKRGPVEQLNEPVRHRP